MRVHLGENENITIVTDEGHEVLITIEREQDNALALQLGGRNCDLDGVEPGRYTLTPLNR